MTHLTGFTWFSARRGRRRGAEHHEMTATTSEIQVKPAFGAEK